MILVLFLIEVSVVIFLILIFFLALISILIKVIISDIHIIFLFVPIEIVDSNSPFHEFPVRLLQNIFEAPLILKNSKSLS